MKRASEFFKSILVGGILVILPSAIFLFILNWVFGLVRKVINPLTTFLMTKSHLQGVVVDVLVIILLIMACFVVGVTVRTRLGKWFHSLLESRILLKFPGYSLIKETVYQFLGKKKSPFSSVALAQIFENDTLVSAFITDEHVDGSYTVFVPTAPNPTSGNIYHLHRNYVHPVDVSVEDTMRSIIGCGAGSSRLIAKYKEGGQPNTPGNGVKST
ncbi:MAG TPA: DUF502 domain-containing protein [Anaerolineae bacterium]|nr:DUF502 domain-containing protein [Anaerolineae bacterium]